jgi:glycosyltransferase involved in cell wall biosynthesis
MHEPSPELFVTKYGPGRYCLVYRLVVLMERLSIKYADQVLTVNEALRERFIARGAHRQKIHVVRNVPDEKFIANMTAQSFGKRFTLLTHGTIVERYGQEVIIRALSLLREKIDDLHLLIVGDGEDTKKVRSLADKLGCSDIVTFIGRVPFPQIGEFISRANIGVVPLLRSPFSELCQPNKMFEYVAYRKAVIASRLRAIEESFDDSCVMFFEPGNHEDLARCIVELYHNPERQHELAENAYRRYQSMRWSLTKEVYLEVVKDLVGK